MDTIIYTFENGKPVFFKKERFIKINSRKEYNKLVDSLIKIDAVFIYELSSRNKKYPRYFELQCGFGCFIQEISTAAIKTEIDKLEKIIS